MQTVYGVAIQIRMYCAGDHTVRLAGGHPVGVPGSDATNAGNGNGRRGNDREHARRYSAGTNDRFLLSAVRS